MKSVQPPISRHHHLRHWHHVYRHHRRRSFDINAKHMSIGQIASLIGAIVAGVLLDMNKETLAIFTGAFVILPGVFDLTCSLGASLSAKIYHRQEDSEASLWRIFLATLFFTLAIAALAGLIVAGLGALIADLFFGADFRHVFILAELSIILCCLVAFPSIGLLSMLFIKLNISPDNVIGPIESSIYDILTILSLSFIAGLML